MRNNLRLHHKILGRIRQWLENERVTRQRNLAFLVIGLYLTGSVHLTKIGSKLPASAKKLSLADRLRRFLRNTVVTSSMTVFDVKLLVIYASCPTT